MKKKIKTICFFTAITALFFSTVEIKPSLAKEAQPVLGSASGVFSIDGKKIKLNHAYAVAQPNTFDENKIDIAVLLTEKPIPVEELKGIQNLQDATQGKHNWTFFKLDEKGAPIHEVINHRSLGDSRLIMTGFTIAKFIPQLFSKNRIAGSFKTKGAENFGKYKYEIDVKFNASVMKAKRPEPLPNEKTGKALPSDGGEPGKTYMTYYKAVQKKDIPAVLKFVEPQKISGLSDKEIKEGVELIAKMSPKNQKITKGYADTNGDRAALYLTATEDGENSYGTVELIKKDGTWKIVNESWNNSPPKK